MDLNTLLGIDLDDPQDRLAEYIVESDAQFMADLVERRRDLGLSQDQVAARMGIHKSNVSRIERGDRDLLQSTLRRYLMAIETVAVHELRAFDDFDGAHKARTYYARGGMQPVQVATGAVSSSASESPKTSWVERQEYVVAHA